MGESLLKLTALLYVGVLAASIAGVYSEQCPRDGSCPNLLEHDIDLSPLHGYDIHYLSSEVAHSAPSTSMTLSTPYGWCTLKLIVR